MANRTLEILITAKDQASKVLKGVEGSLKGAEDASKSFGTALLGIGAGVVGFGAMAVKAYQESEVAGKRLDQIAKQVTGSTDEQIESFKKLASQLQKVGVVEDDVVIAGQSQLSSFTKSSAVVTNLTNSLADLAVAQYGTNVSQEQAIGIANLMGKALSGNLGALTKTGVLVNDEFRKAFENANNEEERSIILNKIIQDNYGGLNKAMRETSQGGLQALKNNFGDFMENVGAKLIPILNNLVVILNDFSNNTLPAMITRFEEAVTWFTNNQWAIYAIAGAITGALVPAIYSMIAGLVATAVAIAPFLIGGAIIGGLVAGIVWVVQNWNMLSSKAVEIFTSIGSFFAGIWSSITSALTTAWNSISSFFQSIWNGIVAIFQFAMAFINGLVIAIFDAMGIDIIAVFNDIKVGLKFFWDALTLMFNTFLLAVQFVWESVWNTIANFLSPIWEKIKSVVSIGWNALKSLFQSASKPMSDAWSSMWTVMGNNVSAVWETIKATIKSGINWVLDKINYIIRKANDVASIGAVAGFTPPKIPEIPMLAKGGIVTRPTLAMIGEAGAEAVIPLNKANGLGGGVTIIVNGDVSGQDLIDKVSNAIMSNLRNNTQIAF